MKLIPSCVRTLGSVVALLCAAAVQAAPQPVTLLMPAPPNLPGFAPWVIAKEKGYYQRFGYDVNLVAAKGGADVAKQVGSGNALFGVGNGDTPIIVRANGVPVKAVVLLGQYPHTLLALDPAKQIHSVQDLRGKTITVMSYSDSMYYTLLATLRAAGMDRKDVNIQAAGPAGVWQLFADGKADAMAGSADWVVNIQDSGRPLELLPREQLFDAMSQAVIASDQAIAEQPQAVQAIVNGTLLALHDILTDPAEAARVFAKAVPAYAGKEDKVERTFALYIERIYGKQAHLGGFDAQRVARSRDFYTAEGIVRQAEPPEVYYTNQFVDRANASLPLGMP
ncbi:nitrate ABC transporter substrate-binding protein [Pseudomonas alkylphenolica]|uniref:Nitrate ABC transporter substrate-binding protein n=1 Tax=Pseudomonas alkylphenolica TaxID=237609 RepID=A0A443ZJM6_9PSED|nr:ABC transporter substrate-binding protein [Pseudomonas alkylphenolica]RWU19017.1 nitrate ABC transporter substrate-binding protein [Pseudomonas alkylphenolica]